MRKAKKRMRILVARNAITAVSIATIGLSWCSNARAGGVPVFTAGQAGTFTHLSGTPTSGDSPYHVALPINPTTPRLMTHSIGFISEVGNTNASAGLANVQSSTSTKIIIGSGTGVSQTDPNNSETASSLEVFFQAEWTVPAAGFGAPLAGNFSLPIGARVGAFGSAGVSCTMDWDYIRSGGEFPLDHYQAAKNFPATDFTQNIVTSLTAPTVLFSPNQLLSGDILVMTGDITFTADADDPTLIEIPTAADFSAQGVTTDQVASFSADVVPEPSSAVMISSGASALLLRRRKRYKYA